MSGRLTMPSQMAPQVGIVTPDFCMSKKLPNNDAIATRGYIDPEDTHNVRYERFEHNMEKYVVRGYRERACAQPTLCLLPCSSGRALPTCSADMLLISPQMSLVHVKARAGDSASSGRRASGRAQSNSSNANATPLHVDELKALDVVYFMAGGDANMAQIPLIFLYGIQARRSSTDHGNATMEENVQLVSQLSAVAGATAVVLAQTGWDGTGSAAIATGQQYLVDPLHLKKDQVLEKQAREYASFPVCLRYTSPHPTPPHPPFFLPSRSLQFMGIPERGRERQFNQRRHPEPDVGGAGHRRQHSGHRTQLVRCDEQVAAHD
jgi:hypothetical protein